MNKGKDRRNGPEYRLCKGAILWFAILPSYYLIYNLLLFGTTTTQIDTGSFYAFMSHEVSKQRYVIELLQKILGKPMTERVRINDFLIHTVFCGIVLQLLGDTSCSDTLSETIEKKVTTCAIAFDQLCDCF